MSTTTMDELSKTIEYTGVKIDTTPGDVRSLCKQAQINKYRAICINSGYIGVAFEELKDVDDVIIVCTAGFPVGGASREAKIYEAIRASERGAREIDFMVNIGNLKDRKDKETKGEIKDIVRNTKGLSEVKIVIEAPILTQEEISRVCNMAVEEGAAYIVAATGFNGAVTVDMVKNIRSIVGDKIKIKAAGGIEDVETAKAMLRAGADTIGTGKVLKFED